MNLSYHFYFILIIFMSFLNHFLIVYLKIVVFSVLELKLKMYIFIVTFIELIMYEENDICVKFLKIIDKLNFCWDSIVY